MQVYPPSTTTARTPQYVPNPDSFLPNPDLSSRPSPVSELGSTWGRQC